MQKVNLENKTVFITGVAGFIGSNLAERLLKEVEGIKIVGLDNMNDYYDVRLKEYRLEKLSSSKMFSFVKGNLADKEVINSIFDKYKPQVVVNLGAQAGVRYSITNPDAYIEGNLIGFYNILEGCRHYPVEHLVYASSSSVYGSNKKVPYSTEDKVDNPVSLYAATKKSNELMAHAYSKLYNIPSTGLRFFTVYGPAGRPDMAYFGFTNKLLNGETIKIFNYGNCKRDFTYVDDIVTGVTEVMQRAPLPNQDGVRYKVYNIGNHQPENLLDFVKILEEELKRAEVLPEDYDFQFPTPTFEKTRIGNILEDDVDDRYTLTDTIWNGFQRRKQNNINRGAGFGYCLFDENSPYVSTLVARYYKDGQEILIDQGNDKNPRKLTPRECARLQGFPDSFIIPVSNMQAYKQFGNSVAVPVVRAVAKRIVEEMNTLPLKEEVIKNGNE